MMNRIVPTDFETFLRSHFFEEDKIDSKDDSRSEKEIDTIIHTFVYFATKDNYIDTSSGETFYRLPYAEISKLLFENNQEKFSPTNLEMCRSLILERLEQKIKILIPNDRAKQNHIVSCYKRITEHMLLATIQKKYMAELSIDAIQEAVEAKNSAIKIQDKIENITTQFVTILGIFASIIVALFGGMSLVKAAVELLNNDGSIPVFVFVISVIMLSFMGLIVLLTSWITSLNKYESIKTYNLTKLVIFCFLLVCAVGSALIIYDLSKHKKPLLNKSSADLKFEIKTSN